MSDSNQKGAILLLLITHALVSGCSGVNRAADYYSEPACKNARDACDDYSKYRNKLNGERDDYMFHLEKMCQESQRSCTEVINDRAKLMRY